MGYSVNFKFDGFWPTGITIKHTISDSEPALSASRAGKAALAGIKASAVAAGTIISGIFATGRYINWTDQKALPLLIGGTAVAGVAYTVRSMVKQITAQSAEEHSFIQPNELSTEAKVVKTLKSGWNFYTGALAGGFCGVFSLSSLIGKMPGEILPLEELFLGSALIGAGMAVKTHYSLSQKKVDGPLPVPSSDTSISKTISISKIAAAAGTGLMEYATALGTTSFGAAALGSSPDIIPVLAGGSGIYGIYRAIKKYRQTTTDPSSILPLQSTVSKVIQATTAGLKVFAAGAGGALTLLHLFNLRFSNPVGDAFFATLAGAGLLRTYALLSQKNPDAEIASYFSKIFGNKHVKEIWALSWPMVASAISCITAINLFQISHTPFRGALVGNVIMIPGIANYVRTAHPIFWKNWCNTRAKKAGLLAASFIAITTYLLGPAAMAEHTRAGALAIRDAGVQANEELMNMRYVNITESVTKTHNEWMRLRSEEDTQFELDRLVQLIQEGDVSCAETLQTCNLEPTDLSGHKKAYKKKALKFHPDKFKSSNPAENESAEKVMRLLNQMDEIVRLKKVCPGKEEIGCVSGDVNITVHKKLITPHWFFGKIMQTDLPACYSYQDGNAPEQIPLEDCSHLIK